MASTSLILLFSLLVFSESLTIGISQKRFVIGNILAANGLAMNSLIANAILANAILANAIVANAIVANALTGEYIDPNTNSLSIFLSYSLDALAAKIQSVPANVTNTIIPQLMDFYVGCALDANESWNMTYNGTHYTFGGGVGLSPSVLTDPPSTEQAQWLSACLMARVNYFGKHVLISLRGGSLSSTPAEEAQYDVFEGAFFGNVFSNIQQKYACQGVPKSVALQESPDRYLRVCTDGDEYCNFTTVGPCADFCSSNEGPCVVNGTTFNDVIGVFLQGNAKSGGSLMLPVGNSVIFLLFAVVTFVTLA